MPILETIESARRSGNWSLVTAAIPYASFLGIEVDGSSGELVSKMRFSPDLIGNPTVPALHGGTLGALLESAAIFQLLWESETAFLPKTISITVDYLHAGRPRDTFAKGVITKLGRRIAVVQVSAWQENRDRPIATANAHFLLPGEAPG